ncbi:hypothetical protein IL306_013033 [Fusarium sp. DS 682]|nr:hypothetical protein IL306_013033 [Fusarium sp. DS 682]
MSDSTDTNKYKYLTSEVDKLKKPATGRSTGNNGGTVKTGDEENKEDGGVKLEDNSEDKEDGGAKLKQ